MGNVCDCRYQQTDLDTEIRPEQLLHQVTSLKDLKLQASDFVMFNNGKFTDHYKVSRMLGEGAYGQVFEANNKKSGIKRAVKTLVKAGFYNDEERQRFITEVQLLQKMDHPNILKLYEVFEDEAKYYVVTEICTGGELFDEIVKRQRFSELDGAKLLRQVLQAVNYCHSNNICHRDLKPENILLEKGSDQIKVIDFGTAIAFNPEQGMTTMLGTPIYMAPEIFNNGRYDEKCDVWSLGVILYCLLTGQPPFYGNSDAEAIQRVKTGVYPKDVLLKKRISEQAQDLISKMLTKDPTQRISVAEALQHDWIQLKAVSETNLEHAQEALSNLQSFNADQKMQQAVLQYIVSQLVTDDEIKNTKEIFKNLDVNNDGKLSREELIEGYRKIYGDFAEEEVDKILAIADTDGSGTIEYSEWLSATTNRKTLISDEKLKNAFQFFDKDGSGAISTDELREILGVKKRLVDEHVWNDLIKDVDQDGNGEVDYEEFKLMMTKLMEGEIAKNLSHQSTRSSPP